MLFKRSLKKKRNKNEGRGMFEDWTFLDYNDFLVNIII